MAYENLSPEQRMKLNELLSMSTIKSDGTIDGQPNETLASLMRGPTQQQPLSRQDLSALQMDNSEPGVFFGSGQANQAPQMPQNYFQRGNNAPVDLGPSRSGPLAMGGPDVALDYSSPIEMAGVKGYRAKGDPFTAYMQDGTRLSMGRDTGAERARTKENLALDKARADIAHTNAVTAQTGIKPDTTPAGYRKTVTGNLEAIPGGPADQKIAGQYNADIAQLQSSSADLDRLATSANELLKTSNLGRITGLVGALPNIPGMEGADAQAKLNTLKSQVGFGVLQAMRNASKTGGALGNVSDAEGKRLEANLAALENAQSEKQMRESLQKIVDFSAGAKDRLSNAFNLRHNPENTSTPMGSQGGGKGASNQTQKYSGAEIQAVALRTGKTESQVREDMKAKGLL